MYDCVHFLIRTLSDGRAVCWTESVNCNGHAITSVWLSGSSDLKYAVHIHQSPLTREMVEVNPEVYVS